MKKAKSQNMEVNKFIIYFHKNITENKIRKTKNTKNINT